MNEPTIVSNGRRGNTVVPNFRWEDARLDPFDLRVAGWIASHTDTYRSKISRNEISRRTGMSVGKVTMSLQKLESLSIINVGRTNGHPVRIVLNVEVWEDDRGSREAGTRPRHGLAPDHDVTGTRPPGDHIEEQLEQQEEDTCSSGDERPPATPPGDRLFEQNLDDFWSMYPRRVGKPAAKKALRAALRKDAAAVIATGLAAWVEFWKASATEPGFIPYPATWLNQERWNDAPPPLPEKPVPAPSRADDVSINIALDDATEFFVGRELLQWRHEHIIQLRATIRTMHNWGFELGETMIRIGIAARRPPDMIEPSKLAKLPRVARFAGMPPGDLSEAMETAYRNLAWRAS